MKAEGWAKALLPTPFGHISKNCLWHITCGPVEPGMIHFKLNFVYGVKEGSIFILPSQCEYPIFPVLLVEKTFLFPLNCIDIFLEYQLTTYVWTLCYIAYSITTPSWYWLEIWLGFCLYVWREDISPMSNLPIHGPGLLLLFI